MVFGACALAVAGKTRPPAAPSTTSRRRQWNTYIWVDSTDDAAYRVVKNRGSLSFNGLHTRTSSENKDLGSQPDTAVGSR
jgi:hypothetical protein